VGLLYDFAEVAETKIPISPSEMPAGTAHDPRIRMTSPDKTFQEKRQSDRSAHLGGVGGTTDQHPSRHRLPGQRLHGSSIPHGRSR